MILKMFENKCTYENKLVITISFIFHGSQAEEAQILNPQNTMTIPNFVVIEQNLAS